MPLANNIEMPLANINVPWQKEKPDANVNLATTISNLQVLSTSGSDELNTDEELNQVDDVDSICCEREIELTNITKAGHPVGHPTQFSLIQILGEGSFGRVFLVKKIHGPDSGTLYAMKVLRKATLKVLDRVRSKLERDILAEVNHPFIVKLNYAFQTEGKLYLVLDYLKGGDLFTRLNKEVMFTEEDVKFYLAELALALDHLHSLGIIYRDLKPENILLDADGHISLTDFGLSKESLQDKKTYSFCGTVEYMAPEIITRKGHTNAVDWWSFGVLMYEMLTGVLPFQALNRKETLQEIIRKKLSMPPYLSLNAQDLLRCLFKRNPANRLGSGPLGGKEIKNHPFFKSIDFEKLLLKQITPPYKPAIANIDFTSVDNEFLNRPAEDSPGVPPSANSYELFRGFSFISPLLVNDAANKDSKTNVNNISTNTNLNENSSSSRLSAIKNSSSLISKLKQNEVFNKISGIKSINEFDFLQVIGQGSFSTCYSCVHKETKKKYAAKKIDKFKRDCSEEVEIMLRFSQHPNIVTLHNFYESDEHVYLFLDYLEGGELLDRILEKKFFCEKEASEVLEVIARAIKYLHENGVVHRDLKPSNIMYADDSGNPNSIRICDFGFAKQMRAGNGLLMTPCYTANFVAPEVLKKQGYDEACDIWSLGVLLYTMLCGYPPFVSNPNDSPNKILKKIGEFKIDMNVGNWSLVSDAAKSLTKKMLCLDPKQRYKARDILKDPFITLRNHLPTVNLTASSKTSLKLIKENMGRVFNAINAPKIVVQLDSVSNSDLARRRAKKKFNV